MRAELFFGSLLWQIPSGSEDETQTVVDHMIRDLIWAPVKINQIMSGFPCGPASTYPECTSSTSTVLLFVMKHTP